MKALTSLITELETALEKDGEQEFIIDKNTRQLLGDLLQIEKGFTELTLTLRAAQKDYERTSKTNAELVASCELQHRTIKEQSETLNNREKVVEEAETAYHDMLSERDQLLQKIDDLTEVHERVKAEAIAAMIKGGDITPQNFADALDAYSLAVARISTTEAHPQIVVALVQMAMHMRNLENMSGVINWLHGSQ